MNSSPNNIAENLRKLCNSLSSDPENAYELAISYLSSTCEKNRAIQDEKLISQKVFMKLASQSTKDADKFNEYYQKIKSSVVLKQRASILSLLLALAEPHGQGVLAPQLFPVPLLATKSSTSATAAPASTSKSTINSAGWGSNGPKPTESNHSLPSANSYNALVLQASDRSTERNLVRDAILAAMGVRTRGGGTASRPQQTLYSRIAHLGFLHDRLKEFIDPASGLMPKGLMGEGLVTSIRDELTEYYRSVAILQAQAAEGDGAITLRRMFVWAVDPMHRLTWLANIAHAVQHKKGGELASCVHRFVHHGDERVAGLARRLLTALTYPLLLMLSRWLLHGEIEDPYNEFFIESRTGVPIDRMWHDKYRVREWMVPSFMGAGQAAQILATGKSVVFMREACAGDDAPSNHALQLHKLLKPPIDRDASSNSATWWEAEELREALTAAHAVASQRLLSALTTHHHLLDHLVAHRRYLLLAQGDFVHHLMTLMQDELCKPASSLYVHNLACTLEAAVRATNAQFEPPHVLSRLHVNLYPNCDGRGGEDSGWDVFALQYRVDGPLGTLFPATCAARYRALFTQLWRVKRTEHSLHDAWREHVLLNKRLNFMPEVWGLMRRVSCFRAEALRVVAALQEAGSVGSEGAWRALLATAADGKDLDHLLALHHTALERHAIDAMIHHTTQELQSYLGNVLNETLALCSFEAALAAGVGAELERREQLERMKGERLARGEYAFTAADEAHDKEMRKIFLQFLANQKADLNVWARTYRGHVTTLILKLALHAEVSLQTLAFRLDYSDYYKRADASLHEPLTYKRMSEIGLKAKKSSRVTDRSKKK